MQIITRYIFDEEDRRLLSIELPDDPCKTCNPNGCCGCPKATEYADTVKPYRDRNIYDIALKFKRQKEIRRRIEKLQKEYDEIVKEIKETGILD